jgi:hypothetical protein
MIIRYIGRIGHMDQDEDLEAIGNIAVICRNDVSNITQEQASRICVLLNAYADTIVAGMRERMSIAIDDNSNITKSCGYVAFKHVIQSLIDTPKKRNILHELIQSVYSGLSIPRWKSLVRKIQIELHFSEEYCKAACSWLKFATHTEAQVLAILQKRENDFVVENIFPDTSGGFGSLFVPCESCRMIPWVDNSPDKFWFILLDDSTDKALKARMFTVLPNEPYTWERIKYAFTRPTMK